MQIVGKYDRKFNEIRHERGNVFFFDENEIIRYFVLFQFSSIMAKREEKNEAFVEIME